MERPGQRPVQGSAPSAKHAGPGRRSLQPGEGDARRFVLGVYHQPARLQRQPAGVHRVVGQTARACLHAGSLYRAMRSGAAPAPLPDTVRRSPRPRSPIPPTAWRRCDACNVQAFSRCASAPGWGENTPRTRSKPRSTLKPPLTWRPRPVACKGRSTPRPPRGGIDAADGGVLSGVCRLSARILLPVAQCADHA